MNPIVRTRKYFLLIFSFLRKGILDILSAGALKVVVGEAV
jgi:hypothetical protein